ncbi:MAG TPA: hypothetical protein VHZ07_20875 [Bryobacteraceae bacterium]|jgi:hypothetical protein|nr:hypothetical protein [Bryobacteraceae bacterium]
MSDAPDLDRLWRTPDAAETREQAKPGTAPATDDYEIHPQQAHRNGYVPFYLRDRTERVQLVPVSAPSRFPAYSSLLDIIFDHDHQSAFTLVYSFMLVKVIGTNLGPIVHALNFGRCAAIHQFQAKRFKSTPDPDKPLVETIEIVSAVDKTAGVKPADRP